VIGEGLSLMRTYTIEAFPPITIVTKQLKSVLGKSLLSQPDVCSKSTRDCFSLLFSIIKDMVNSKKLRSGLATALANTSIGFQNLFPEFNATEHIKLIHLGLARIAKNFVDSTESTTVGAESFFSRFSVISFSVHTLTDFMFDKRIRTLQKVLILVFVQIWIAFKRLFILRMAATSTAVTEFVSSSLIGAEVFRGSIMPLLAFGTLVAAFLRYNGIHGTSPLSHVSSFPRSVSSTRGGFIMPFNYSIKRLVKQAYGNKEIQVCHNQQQQEVDSWDTQRPLIRVE